MRIMAVDLGDARTGVAVSDESATIAGYTTVICSHCLAEVLEKICAIAREHDVAEIVMGLPINMDGSSGERAEKYREFAQELERKSGIPVILRDERRTTIMAHDILHAVGRKEKEHKNMVDAVAATLILEDYLEYRKNTFHE